MARRRVQGSGSFLETRAQSWSRFTDLPQFNLHPLSQTRTARLPGTLVGTQPVASHAGTPQCCVFPLTSLQAGFVPNHDKNPRQSVQSHHVAVPESVPLVLPDKPHGRPRAQRQPTSSGIPRAANIAKPARRHKHTRQRTPRCVPCTAGSALRGTAQQPDGQLPPDSHASQYSMFGSFHRHSSLRARKDRQRPRLPRLPGHETYDLQGQTCQPSWDRIALGNSHQTNL